MPATLQSTVRLLFLALLFATASAHADEYQDVNQLMAAGKLGEAMTKADAYLSGKPGDPQMRFLKGVLQRNSGKQTEAIATYRQAILNLQGQQNQKLYSSGNAQVDQSEQARRAELASQLKGVV